MTKMVLGGSNNNNTITNMNEKGCTDGLDSSSTNISKGKVIRNFSSSTLKGIQRSLRRYDDPASALFQLCQKQYYTSHCCSQEAITSNASSSAVAANSATTGGTSGGVLLSCRRKFQHQPLHQPVTNENGTTLHNMRDWNTSSRTTSSGGGSVSSEDDTTTTTTRSTIGSRQIQPPPNLDDPAFQIFLNDVYLDVHHILKKNVQIVHATNEEGYNALHYVCMNPSLGQHESLIQLLVETSSAVENIGTSNQGKGRFLQRKQTMARSKSTSDAFVMKTTSPSKALPPTRHASLLSLSQPISSSPSPAPILWHKVHESGELPLHCLVSNLYSYGYLQNTLTTTTTTEDISHPIYEYLIHCNPSAICVPDKIQRNLPIHVLCQNIIIDDLKYVHVLYSLIRFFVDQWPESCQMVNQDGDTPLHLAVRQCTRQTPSAAKNAINNISTQTKDVIERLSLRASMNHNNGNQMNGPYTKDHRPAPLLDIKVMDSLKDLDLSDDDSVSSANDERDVEDKECIIDTRKLQKKELVDNTVKTNVRDNLHSSFQSDHERLDPDYIKKIKLPDVFLPESERQQMEREEKIRKEKQLDIVKYLVEIYPEALQIRNKMGFNPIQVAKESVGLLSTKEKKQAEYQLNRDGDGNTSDQSLSSNNGSITSTGSSTEEFPVITFLRHSSGSSSMENFRKSGNNGRCFTDRYDLNDLTKDSNPWMTSCLNKFGSASGLSESLVSHDNQFLSRSCHTDNNNTLFKKNSLLERSASFRNVYDDIMNSPSPTDDPLTEIQVLNDDDSDSDVEEDITYGMNNYSSYNRSLSNSNINSSPSKNKSPTNNNNNRNATWDTDQDIIATPPPGTTSKARKLPTSSSYQGLCPMNRNTKNTSIGSCNNRRNDAHNSYRKSSTKMEATSSTQGRLELQKKNNGITIKKNVPEMFSSPPRTTGGRHHPRYIDDDDDNLESDIDSPVVELLSVDRVVSHQQGRHDHNSRTCHMNNKCSMASNYNKDHSQDNIDDHDKYNTNNDKMYNKDNNNGSTRSPRHIANIVPKTKTGKSPVYQPRYQGNNNHRSNNPRQIMHL